MEKFLILDANSIIHRVYHALPPLTTKNGELVNAIYGFLSVLFRIIKDFKPKYICACFDFPAKTFRHEELKEYKAQRPPLPKDLSVQIPKIKEILKIFKIPFFEKEGFEADDLIGTIVSKIQGLEKIIVSGDFDNLQLISKETKVFVLSGIKKSVLYGEEEIKEKYLGLKPNQIPDFKALVGDVSDNIKGVPGIGKKTAIELILKFESIEKIFEEIEKNSFKIKEISPKLKKTLLEFKEKIFLNKKLVQIKNDAPIDFSLKECTFLRYNKEEVIEVLKRYEFYSLIKRLEEIESILIGKEETKKKNQLSLNL
jgi:DNA polymerase-1